MHGHIHAREEYNFQNKADGIRRYDVGVDANDYYPAVSYTHLDVYKRQPFKRTPGQAGRESE